MKAGPRRTGPLTTYQLIRAPDLVTILSNDAVLNVEVVHHPHRNPGANRQRVIRKTLAVDQLEGHLQIVEHPLRCGIPLDWLYLGLGTAFEDPGIVFQHLTLAVMNHPTRGHFPCDVIVVKLLKRVKLFGVLELKMPVR